MASLKDIAKRAGTSIATVSLTLHGGSEGRRRVSPEKEALIKNIAEELNYAPAAAARMMLSNKSGQIGVVIRNAPDKPMHNPPNYEIIVGLSDALADAGCLPLIIPLKIAGGVLEDLRIFKERLLDGIIFTDCVPESVYEKTSKLQKACVFVESEWRPFNCIRRDESGIAAMAVDRMASLGAKRIAYFGLLASATTHFSVPFRRDGVAARSRELGLDFKDICVRRAKPDVEIHPPTALPIAFHSEFLDRVRTDAQKLAAEIEPGGKTAIICYNSILAHAAYSCLAEQGLLAGRDYSLCSCDTCFEMELNWPELACCEFNRYETGKAAAKMLLEIMRSGKPQPSISAPSTWRDGATAISTQGAKP